jgi:hypothetical protein
MPLPYLCISTCRSATLRGLYFHCLTQSSAATAGIASMRCVIFRHLSHHSDAVPGVRGPVHEPCITVVTVIMFFNYLFSIIIKEGVAQRPLDIPQVVRFIAAHRLIDRLQLRPSVINCSGHGSENPVCEVPGP